MKQTYLIAAGACFMASFLVGIWPKACLDKARRMLAAKGEDPNQKFGVAKIRELNAGLSRQYRTGLVIATLCSIAFAVFTMLALFG